MRILWRSGLRDTNQSEDKGTVIKYIKDLLGHFNIKTTERYLHVSKKQLINIVSPLDDLFKKENIEW